MKGTKHMCTVKSLPRLPHQFVLCHDGMFGGFIPALLESVINRLLVLLDSHLGCRQMGQHKHVSSSCQYHRHDMVLREGVG